MSERRSDAAAELDEIDRIHDDDPAEAARRLRELDASALPAQRLGALAFLVNHVLGEKLGAWREAAERSAALAARDDAPVAVLRHWAAAAVAGLGRPAGAARLRSEATALAAAFDASLRRLIEQDAAELFAPEHP